LLLVSKALLVPKQSTRNDNFQKFYTSLFLAFDVLINTIFLREVECLLKITTYKLIDFALTSNGYIFEVTSPVFLLETFVF